LPTTHNWLRNTQATTIKLKRHLKKALQISPRPTLYADYETYLRQELRPWAESILYNPSIAEQGLFNPDFLSTLLSRHFSGLEQWTIGKIAPIMTYQMMLGMLL
jgi:asparagine synthase (glutamine-hydrolysing)